MKSQKGEIDKSSSLLKYTIASHPGVEFENIVNLSLKYTCIKFTNNIQPSKVFFILVSIAYIRGGPKAKAF